MNLGDKAIAQLMGAKYRLSPIVEVHYEYKPIAEGENIVEKNGVVIKTVERQYVSYEGRGFFDRGTNRTEKRDLIIEPIKGVFNFYYDDPDETNQDREKHMRDALDVDHWLRKYQEKNGVPFEFIIKNTKKLKRNNTR